MEVKNRRPQGATLLNFWDYLQADSFPDETIRHELAHLFSAHLGDRKPAFKREGFSVWAQGSQSGKPIDFHALATILSGNEVPLSFLLSDARFSELETIAYPLAGSFAGYLVHRFGWETYCRFYATANDRNFERSFEQIFGVSLFKAEREWKQWLMERRNEFEPELALWVRRKRLLAAYNDWQFWLCIDEVEALMRDGDEDWETVWYAAASHFMVGNYQRSLELLLQLTEREDAGLKSFQAYLWLEIGNITTCSVSGKKPLVLTKKPLSFPIAGGAKKVQHIN